MERAICRVCMGKPEKLVNIFESTTGSRTSIADMISECTGYKVYPGDPYPKTICPPCLQDTESAFAVKQLYKRSCQVYSQREKKVPEEKDLIVEEIHTIPEPERTERTDCPGDNGENSIQPAKGESLAIKVKEEITEEELPSDQFEIHELPEPEETEHTACPDNIGQYYIQSNSELFHITVKDAVTEEEQLPGNQFEYQVKNELLEDGECEPNGYQNSDFDMALESQSQVRSEDTEEDSNSMTDSGSSSKGDPRSPLPYPCTVCQETFAKTDELIAHLVNHARPPKPPRAYKPRDPMHSAPKLFTCPQCQKSFTSNSYLQKHIKNHTDDRLIQCLHCPKKFTTKTAFTSHFRFHTRERKYKCLHCEKSCKSKKLLKSHMIIHTDEGRYMCSHCQRSFTKQSTLDKHTKTHLEAGPYKCTYCEESYDIQGQLKIHLCTHTGEKPYECPVSGCYRTFLMKAHLGTHMKKHNVDSS